MRKLRNTRRPLNQSGQTMVDLMIALALISGSVASAGVLSTTSNRVALDSGHRTQAIGLAEREVEGLRAYRDTFERLGIDWNTTLLGVASPACSYFTMTSSGADWTPVSTGGTNVQVSYDPSSGGKNGGDPQLTTNYPGFSRVVETCPSNDYQQTDYNQKNPSGPLNMITNSSHVRIIKVTVNWLEGTQTKQLIERSIIGDYGQ